MKQLPVLPPDSYSESDRDFIVPRVVELTFTGYDLLPFAEDILAEDGESTWNRWFPQNQCSGDQGTLKPFAFDPERRALLRAELDAYYAKLYGLTHEELRYILDPADVVGEDYPTETFRVLKNSEMSEFGEYRTKRLVLEAWDRLSQKNL